MVGAPGQKLIQILEVGQNRVSFDLLDDLLNFHAILLLELDIVDPGLVALDQLGFLLHGEMLDGRSLRALA